MNKRFDYAHQIDQCDILDKEKGKAFRQKRLIWMEWLNGQDPQSISPQIYSMLWDYALFRVVNELRKIAAMDPENGVRFNNPVIHLFDAGFVTKQVISIRRLTEKPKYDPKWAIISLHSVIDDIKTNVNLITRENYVCYDGLPYDYEAVQRQWLSTLSRESRGVHVGLLPTNGPNTWPMSERVHKTFDKLSGVEPENRKRTDVIRADIFTFLKSQIETCKDIKNMLINSSLTLRPRRPG